MVTNINLNDGKYIATFEICDNNEDYSICNLGQKLTNDVIQVNKTFIDIDIYKSQMKEKDQRIAELEQELAELKEKAIVPKFKIGQEVFIVDKNYFKIEHYKIANCKILGIEDKLDRKNNYVRWYILKIYNSSYEIDRSYKFKEKDVFATEQEAQEKLKEMKGNE